MIETPQQYSARLSGYVEGLNHLKVFEATPKKIAGLIRKKSPAFLSKHVIPGKWSIGEILAHLAESEIVLAYRIRLMVSASGTPIQPFDQDMWQSNAGYLRRNPKKGLQLFTEIRAGNVAFLKSLTKEQWSNFGMHAERGRETVARLVELNAGHDINHMKQIEAIVQSRH